MRRSKLEIENWQPSPKAGKRGGGRSRNGSSTILGLIGTLMLHALIVQTVVFGSHAPRRRPPETQGAGATNLHSAAPPSETLILVDLPQASRDDQVLREELSSLGPAVADTQVRLLSDDPLPHVDIPTDQVDAADDSSTAIDSGDPAARAALYGRYAGQIDARIERAWRRPRSAVSTATEPSRLAISDAGRAPSDDTFKCQVRILQNATGQVQEVQLLSCNGTSPWQQSLVRAIFSASPLPAPPHPSVFTHALTMTFTALPYSTASSSDDYELDSSATTRVASEHP